MRNVIYSRMVSLFLGSLLIGAIIIAAPVIGGMNKVQAQTTTTMPVTTSSPSTTNETTSTTTSSSTTINLELYKRMAEIEYSNKPQDIATLAYIWGYSLIAVERTFNFVTNSNVPPGPGRGPVNSPNCFHSLPNATYTDSLRPSVDTLYCITYFDLIKEPVVIVVPAINDSSRYYSFAFFDAYDNAFAYVGTRATGSTTVTTGDGSSSSTYLLAGPEWNGQVPQGMTKIWSPTNMGFGIMRILVKGPSDLPNVNAIQDKIVVKPLSSFIGKNATTTASSSIVTTNTIQENASSSSSSSSSTSSKQILPISPQPSLIPSTGIKIFDEIGAAMVGNPPNPPDPALVSKLASIGIGPGKTPSKDANETIKAALQIGITEGQKLIDEKVANLGITNNNGWLVLPLGIYGTDYLLRAATAELGIGYNIPQEAYYPTTFTDSEDKPLSGGANNSYVIHFNNGELPPVNAFWSITMYNDNGTLVDNPINRYGIGKYTEGLKNNTDGSFDIYIQHVNPGKDKESNWLPSPSEGKFNLGMRLYLPQPQVFNGTWQYPTVQLQQQQRQEH